MVKMSIDPATSLNLLVPALLASFQLSFIDKLIFWGTDVTLAVQKYYLLPNIQLLLNEY